MSPDGGPAPATVQLARALLRAPEKWGWEYRPPAEPAAFPGRYPEWTEPPEPDLSVEEAGVERARSRRWSWWSAAAALGVLALLVGRFRTIDAGRWSAAFLGAAVLAVGVGHLRVALARRRVRAREIGAQDRRGRMWAEHEGEYRRLRDQHARFDAAERDRYDTEDVLFPLRTSAARVDVFGGTREGRAALLATLGSSALGAGTVLHVLDLTGTGLADGLVDLARSAGVAVRRRALSAAVLERMLARLRIEDVVTALADAVSTLRGAGAGAGAGGGAEARAIDLELVRCVVRELGESVTFDRLADALDVLRSARAAECSLTMAETERLIDAADLFTRTERRTDALHFTAVQMRVLADQARAGGPDPSAVDAHRPSLLVHSIDHCEGEGRAGTAAVAFHVVTRGVHAAGHRADAPLLLIAGADDMGRRSLENTARLADGAGVRLVYLFDRLREATATVLGAGDSTVIFMNLGNTADAEAAARFIGKGHTFQLSQISRQLTESATRSRSRSDTTQEGFSRGTQDSRSTQRSKGGGSSESVGSTRGAGSISIGIGGNGLSIHSDAGSRSANRGRSLSKSWSESVSSARSVSTGESWSTATQVGSSDSAGRSESLGAVVQRSYEYVVEPTAIQTLDPTSFILCDRVAKRVVAADCYPGIAVVARVSDSGELRRSP